MLTPTLRSKIDALWDKFWSGGIANPLTAIEQISYLLFMRRLDAVDLKAREDAEWLGKPHDSVFADHEDLFLKDPPFADVSHNGRKNRVPVNLHFTDCQIDGELLAILPQSNHLAADSNDLGVSGIQIVTNVAVMFRPVGRRHQHADVFPDRLLFVVPENSLRSSIERNNGSVLIGDHHAIDRGVENRLSDQT